MNTLTLHERFILSHVTQKEKKLLLPSCDFDYNSSANGTKSTNILEVYINYYNIFYKLT